MDNQYWGYHLILDVKGCEILKATDGKNIENFAIELVKRIDMVPYGPPRVEHFGHEKPETSGWTLVQLIETSCISAHFCDINGDAYIDVFSCKRYNTQDVIDVVNEYFNPARIREVFLHRQA